MSLSADADTVNATTAPTTLRQAFHRTGTMIEAEPLALPGQEIAGYSTLSDGCIAHRHVIRLWFFDGFWNKTRNFSLIVREAFTRNEGGSWVGSFDRI